MKMPSGRPEPIYKTEDLDPTGSPYEDAVPLNGAEIEAWDRSRVTEVHVVKMTGDQLTFKRLDYTPPLTNYSVDGTKRTSLPSVQSIRDAKDLPERFNHSIVQEIHDEIVADYNGRYDRLKRIVEKRSQTYPFPKGMAYYVSQDYREPANVDVAYIPGEGEIVVRDINRGRNCYVEFNQFDRYMTEEPRGEDGLVSISHLLTKPGASGPTYRPDNVVVIHFQPEQSLDFLDDVDRDYGIKSKRRVARMPEEAAMLIRRAKACLKEDTLKEAKNIRLPFCAVRCEMLPDLAMSYYPHNDRIVIFDNYRALRAEFSWDPFREVYLREDLLDSCGINNNALIHMFDWKDRNDPGRPVTVRLDAVYIERAVKEHRR